VQRFVSETLTESMELMPEFRLCTICFMDFSNFAKTDLDSCQQLQSGVKALFDDLIGFGGELRQLIEDDKGFVGIAVWGWPMCTHEDNASRAVRFALKAQESLREFELSLSVGITTGRCFCGLVGSSTRCEYAAIGDTVNCAARLMGKAQGEVWIDEATMLGCINRQQRISFTRLPKMKMKGPCRVAPSLLAVPAVPWKRHIRMQPIALLVLSVLRAMCCSHYPKQCNVAAAASARVPLRIMAVLYVSECRLPFYRQGGAPEGV
jgi:class 3 adenylate cyclase